MPPKRKGTVVPTKDGRLQPMVRVGKPVGGKSKRERRPAFPAGTSLEDAQRLTAELQEHLDRVHEPPGTRPTALPSPDRDASDEHVVIWLASRERRGVAGPEAEHHWRCHLRDRLGHKHVRDWTTGDLRALVTHLDGLVRAGEIAWKTAKNVWGTATRMCRDAKASKDDAVRCRPDDPSRDVEGPDAGIDRRKVYLFPSEATRLLSCERVPVRWRQWVALALYMGVRAGELRVLALSAFDRDHGRVHIYRAWSNKQKRIGPTKGRLNRHVQIEPTLAPLLDLLLTQPGELIAPTLPSECLLAGELRRYLEMAGVTRLELLERTETSRHLTWHNLRDTCATWRAARGDLPFIIQRQIGHEQLSTTQGYIVEADLARPNFGQPFPPLPPGLLVRDAGSFGAPTATRIAKALKSQRPQRDLNPVQPRNYDEISDGSSGNAGRVSGEIAGPDEGRADRACQSPTVWREPFRLDLRQREAVVRLAFGARSLLARGDTLPSPGLVRAVRAELAAARAGGGR